MRYMIYDDLHDKGSRSSAKPRIKSLILSTKTCAIILHANLCVLLVTNTCVESNLSPTRKVSGGLHTSPQHGDIVEMAGAQLNGSIPGKKNSTNKKTSTQCEWVLGNWGGSFFQDVFWLLGEFFACRIPGVRFIYIYMFIYICIYKYTYYI